MTNQANSEATTHTDDTPCVAKKKPTPEEGVTHLRTLLKRLAERGLAATHFGSAGEEDRASFRRANAADLDAANDLLTDVSVALFGRAVEPSASGDSAEGGDFWSFTLQGQEVLRIEAAGSVFVRGEKVDNNCTIYAALRDFLEGATTEQAPEDVFRADRSLEIVMSAEQSEQLQRAGINDSQLVAAALRWGLELVDDADLAADFQREHPAQGEPK